MRDQSANPIGTYASAAAAADDPDLVLDAATDTFKDLYELVRAGNETAAKGAAVAVQDLTLQICISLAASSEAANDKVRVLAIILGWAWPRAPAVAAVLEVAGAQEVQRWGGDVRGSS